MRRALLAAALFAFCCAVSTPIAQAHGPAGPGHAGGGQGHLAANTASGNGFRGGDSAGQPGGGQFHHDAGAASRGNSSGIKPGPNFNQLHPPVTTGANGTGGSSSSAATTNSSGSGATNLVGGGKTPAAGDIAKLHRLEEQLRRLKREELLQLLQQAKQSNNPQMLAKAEQALQHMQQNHGQHTGNGSPNGQLNQNPVQPTPVYGGQAGGHAPISHGSAPGGHASSHAKR